MDSACLSRVQSFFLLTPWLPASVRGKPASFLHACDSSRWALFGSKPPSSAFTPIRRDPLFKAVQAASLAAAPPHPPILPTGRASRVHSGPVHTENVRSHLDWAPRVRGTSRPQPQEGREVSPRAGQSAPWPERGAAATGAGVSQPRELMHTHPVCP